MADNLTSTAATDYIELNVIDIADWQGTDDAKKQRLLNVANSELERLYSDYEIPNEAVYELAALLAIVYNDTYKAKQYGVASFSVEGISFTFSGGKNSISSLVSAKIKKLIGDANETTIGGTKWTVL